MDELGFLKFFCFMSLINNDNVDSVLFDFISSDQI